MTGRPQAGRARPEALGEVGRRTRGGRSPGVGRALVALITALVAFYLIFPMVLTIPISFNSIERIQFPPRGLSFRWYEEFLGIGRGQDTRWLTTSLLSLQIAAATAVIATVLGGLAAVPIVRRSFRGKGLVQTFLILPLVFPVIVLAVGLFFLYIPLGLLGNPLAIILGHAVLATPYVTIIIAATLKGMDESLEWASLSLGASQLRTLREVTIPLIWPGIAAGALFAFLTSFDELLIALFVSGTGSVTLPRLLWDFIRTEASPVLAVVSTLLTLFSMLFIGLLAFVGRQRT